MHGTTARPSRRRSRRAICGLPVGGRIDRHGARARAARAWTTFGTAPSTSCGRKVCRPWPSASYNSLSQRSHERVPRSACWRGIPECWVTLSSRSRPSWANTSAARPPCLAPIFAEHRLLYASGLPARCSQRGLRTPLLRRPEQRRRDDGRTRASSGLRRCCCRAPRPAIGALGLCRRALGTSSLLSMEIGGTSCDVTLLSNGDAEVASEFDLGGYHVGIAEHRHPQRRRGRRHHRRRR